MEVQPYLFFEGRCEEAIEFYKKKLGAKVDMLMRYKDSPEPPRPGMVPPGSDDKVLHASVKIGGTRVMASDGNCSGKPKFGGFALSLDARDETDAKRLYAALSEGGQPQMPLMKTFFSPAFGMVTDRFGVMWMVIVMPKEQS